MLSHDHPHSENLSISRTTLLAFQPTKIMISYVISGLKPVIQFRLVFLTYGSL
jgi:hypothetical protein